MSTARAGRDAGAQRPPIGQETALHAQLRASRYAPVSGLVDRLLGVPGWLVLVIVGVVVFAEDALFVGFVLPGETVAILGGVAAKLGHVPLAGALAVTVVAAIVGDSVGYEVGRKLGPRMLDVGLLRERRHRIEQRSEERRVGKECRSRWSPYH